MLKGSIVALVTPMQPDGAVDWPALERLVDFHVENGTNGIIAVGTTGESATLPFSEHMQVTERIISHAAGRIPIVAGTGANSTAEAIELTEQAKRLGADYALIVTPYYNKPTQEGLYQHHMAIADKVEIPQILYNVPGRTSCDMLAETVARLKTHPNIVGIKEATGDLQRGAEVIECCGDRMTIYSGDDATAMELILLGAKGNISVTANVAPKLVADVCAAALAGERDKAETINSRLEALNTDLFIESNPIPVKWAMAEMGLINEGIRLPMTWLSPQYHERVRSALRQAGIIESNAK